jgi:Protein of unknown function (DUF3096)
MTASKALRRSSQEVFMVIGIGVGHLQPLVALLAGILILLVPRILNYVIAIYLIIDGIIGLGLIK